MTAPTTKTCSCCHQTLPRESFGHNRQTLDGLMYYCRKCAADKQRQFRKENPESHRASKAKYLDKLRRLNAARDAASITED